MTLQTMQTLLLLLCSATALLWSCGRCQDIENLVEGLLEKQAHKTNLEQNPNLRDEAKDALRKLNHLWTDYFPQYMDNMMSMDDFSDSSNGSSGSLTPECNNSAVAILRNHYRENVTLPEVVTLLDATGKQGAGLLEGNLILDGAFDECFEQNYTGFCVGKVNLTFLPPNPMFSWTVGLCVPKHCTPHDASVVMNSTGIFKVSPLEMSCTDTKRPEYGVGAIVMLVVCAVFVLLVLIGTFVDKLIEWINYLPRRKNYQPINDDKRETIVTDMKTVGLSGSSQGETVPILQQPSTDTQKRNFVLDLITAFSLYKTIPTLLATKQAPHVITSLNGLRVISMFWVILGHAVVFIGLSFDNPLHLLKVAGTFSFQAVGNGFFSVDSFFFLSAVLVAYLTFRQMKKRGRFPVVHYYVHRYLRLTPVYIFALFFTWALAHHLAVGAGFNYSNLIAAGCPKYWWTNFLYINNLYPWNIVDECYNWSWYLANDMQFYVIAPLMLLPLYYFAPVGVIVSGAILLCSFVITATLTGVYDLQANLLAPFAYQYNGNSTQSYMDLIYIKPWARIAPYIVGLLLGYVLYKGVKLPFKSWLKNLPFYLMMWVCSGVLLVSSLYGLYSTWNGHIPSTAENVFYITFSRLAWGLGLALLVFACHNGYGGPINSFLSMKFWIPLSRMTYNAYLAHPVVQYVVYGQMQKSVHYTDITIGLYAVGATAISYGVAAVLCVFVEFPLGSVEMLLFKLVGLGGRESQRHAHIECKGGEKKEEGGEKA